MKKKDEKNGSAMKDNDKNIEMEEAIKLDSETAPDDAALKEDQPGDQPQDGSPDDSEESEETVVDMFKKKADKLEKESKENYDKLLRTMAEFENYKKRSQKEFSDFKKYANESLLKDLLLVVDNLERALTVSKESETAAQNGKGLLEGVELTLKDLLKLMEKYGVKSVEAMGAPFDPSYHQAVMRQESADHEENTVICEYQKGYTLHDRLLRASMVVVSAPGQKKDESSDGA